MYKLNYHLNNNHQDIHYIYRNRLKIHQRCCYRLIYNFIKLNTWIRFI